jgi:endoglucanase
VLLSEFGAYEKADMASRTRWTSFVARTAESRGMAWAYWEFASTFGAYDPTADAYRPDLLNALLPMTD